MRRAVLPVLLVSFFVTSEAQAWEWFRSESSAVARGNQLLREKKYDEAVKAYDEASSATRDEPGVQLDKGTALLGAKKYGPARESLRSASRGDADPEVRGRALYNLGLSFLDEADELSKGEKLEEAQGRLRESVDAFKASLRAKPGNADAAWNLDLARRRLVEVEKKREEQKKEEEEKKKDEKKDDQKQDQNDGGTNKPEDGDAGAGDGGPQSNDQENDAGTPGDDGDQSRDAGGRGGEPDAGGAPDSGAGGAQGEQRGDGGAEAEPLPSRDAMDRALDALRDGEESLQKQRAQARARQRPQRVDKDW